MKDLIVYLKRYGARFNGLESGDGFYYKCYIEDELIKAVYENCKGDGMMTRICNGLMRSGIADMHKLERTAVEDLEKIRNFGASAVYILRCIRGDDLTPPRSTISRKKIDDAILETKIAICANIKLGLNERAYGMRNVLEIFEKVVGK